jgi:hypothetical protein
MRLRQRKGKLTAADKTQHAASSESAQPIAAAAIGAATRCTHSTHALILIPGLSLYERGLALHERKKARLQQTLQTNLMLIAPHSYCFSSPPR